MNELTIEQKNWRRKRFGQYFSGVPLGRLLAGLTNCSTAQSIIDPMGGSGDLLQGCIDVGAKPETLVGIEIDDAVAQVASARLPAAKIVAADAFSQEAIRQLPIRTYDLVIGNPPFVRYQSGRIGEHGLPSAETIRKNLLDLLPFFDDLSLDEREYFKNLITTYSGLSDLAVPACILSMLLVKHRGEIALVLPQSWLTRDYAAPIRSAFDDLFQLNVIVEDDAVTWFTDALVKTTLLVMTRRPHGDRQPRVPGLHLGIPAAAANSNSLIGAVIEACEKPEVEFGELARSTRDASPWKNSPIRAARITQIADLLPAQRMDGSDGFAGELAELISSASTEFVHLGELGVDANQGLRTGANEFFYSKLGLGDEVITSDLFGSMPLSHARSFVRPAIRDQSDLSPEGPTPKHGIFDFRSVALPEDLASCPRTAQIYSPMPVEVAEYVRRAAGTKSGKQGRERLIPNLSAVSANVRCERSASPPRFWYQLPDFRSRHTPDVFVPRINHARPCAFINPGRIWLVDANFVTFTCSADLSATALFALLNSTWAWACLEAMGAIMGGGALKLEATMYRRLPIPRLTQRQISALNSFQNRSVDAAGVDRILLSEAVAPISLRQRLIAFAERRLSGRSKTRRSLPRSH